MMKKFTYLFFTILLLASVLVSGCESAQAPGIAAKDGVLNLYGIDPITLDPAVAGEMQSNEFIVQLFSGLVRLDDRLEPAPDIAQRWQVSKDGMTYTFYLRQDVKFHDGRPLKAGDFKYSWERASDPRTGSMTAATYLGDIVGVKEVLSGKARELSGVRVIDDYTLQVTIDAPKSYFLSKLTYVTAYAVDKANVASGKDWWRQPNGTGPFKFRKWDKNSLLVLDRNDLYYNQPAGVSSVVFQLYSGVPMNLYETGKIDTATVSLNYIDKVSDKSGPFYRELKVVPELSFSYIGFNSTRPPFDDASIRRAFTLAVGKDKLVSLVFKDMMQPAYGILPPGMPGFNKDLAGLRFDVTKAKELIASSKYGSVAKLPPITLTTTGLGGTTSREIEGIIQEWRQNLGVEVKVRQLEPERFLYHLKEEKDEMFVLGWIADYPHPQDFLEILFHSDTDNNYAEYSNPEVDTLMQMAAVEPDNRLSLSLYQQAEQKLVSDAACLPLWFGKNYVLVKPYLDGYDLNPLGLVNLGKVSVRPR